VCERGCSRLVVGGGGGGGGEEEEEYATTATQARVMFNERSFLLFPFLLYFFCGEGKRTKNPKSQVIRHHKKRDPSWSWTRQRTQ
tara:strand:+ start:5572 stop:5826 length:255 start_codon:yes stop_codon:yes gene_type:complete